MEISVTRNNLWYNNNLISTTGTAQPDNHNVRYRLVENTGTCLFVLAGMTVTETLDPRMVCPFFDVFCPYLPEKLRKPLRFGVRHEDVSILCPNNVLDTIVCLAWLALTEEIAWRPRVWTSIPNQILWKSLLPPGSRQCVAWDYEARTLAVCVSILAWQSLIKIAWRYQNKSKGLDSTLCRLNCCSVHIWA